MMLQELRLQIDNNMKINAALCCQIIVYCNVYNLYFKKKVLCVICISVVQQEGDEVLG